MTTRDGAGVCVQDSRGKKKKRKTRKKQEVKKKNDTHARRAWTESFHRTDDKCPVSDFNDLFQTFQLHPIRLELRGG